MNLSPLEQSIFHIACMRMNQGNKEAVLDQLDKLHIINREYSTIGFSTNFSIKGKSKEITDLYDFESAFFVLYAIHPNLNTEASFACLLQDNCISSFEASIMGEEDEVWPKDETLFDIRIGEE